MSWRIVEAVDDHTVRYRFTHRYPYQLMDINDGPIVPAHAWSGIPLDQWEETDWRDLVAVRGSVHARRPHPAAGNRPRTQPRAISQSGRPTIDTHGVPDRPVDGVRS